MSRIRTVARLYVKACKNSKRAFPHTLLYGIGGCGKTVLGRAISNELDYHFVEVLGSVFNKPEDVTEALIRYSDQAKARGKTLLLFIDEVHQLNVRLQESLYTPMKEWRVSTLDGYKNIPPFTLIAATTRFDMLDSNSFVTRFPNTWEVTRYSEFDIACIVAQALRNRGLGFDAGVTTALAARSLGIPRNAMSLVDKVELAALAEGKSAVSMDHVSQTFTLEELDYLGLSPVHLRYMEILAGSVDENGKYSPIGVGAIASKMRQNERVIEGSVEPILLEYSFISPTPRGRKITKLGTEYLRKRLTSQHDVVR